jgi:hypothetical protein
VWTLLLLLGAATPLAAQQATPETRQAAFIRDKQETVQKRGPFLQATGRAQNAAPIRDLLSSAGLYANMPQAARAAFLEELGQRLAATGLTAGQIRALQARGIDIPQAVAADYRGSLEQYAALAEVVVIGQVTEVRQSAAENDGFRSTVVLRVEETLKGQAGSQVTVRESSGVLASGERVEHSIDMAPEAGDRFLLFLSKGLYGAEAVGRGRSPAEAQSSAAHVQQRLGYRILEGDALEPIQMGPPVVAGGLAEARTRIRTVAQAFQGLPAQD